MFPRYSHSHDLTRVVVTEPGGLFVGIGPAVEGRQNDQYTANHSGLNNHLHNADLKALADRGFSNSTNVAAFLKQNQVNPYSRFEITALSAIRTVGIELPFGQLQTAFPLLVSKWKNKIFQTCPDIWFHAAAIISNCIRLENGCNNNTYFGVLPNFTVERYLAGETN